MRKNQWSAQPVAINLRLDWATYQAAKYACEHWHYSKCMPVNKTVKIGAWEDGKFIGVIIFSPGASANLYKTYGLTNIQGCELTRVALTNHKTPVSKILSIGVKMLKKKYPGLRLIISFADPKQGHNGGIYQASNWYYVGLPKSAEYEYFIRGKWVHNRSVKASLGLKKFSEFIKSSSCKRRKTSLKYKYLYPLDSKMENQIRALIKPYPKRATSIDNDAVGFQSTEGGVNPTVALQK